MGNLAHFILAPPMLLLLGGIVSIFIKRRYQLGGYPLRGLWAMLVSLIAGLSLLWLPRDNPEMLSFAQVWLHPLRLDNLSLLFTLCFCFVSFCGHLYALKCKNASFAPNAMFYAGAACGVVLAGDLISLYFFWEIMAVSATFLILIPQNRSSYEAAMRYVAVHIAGGLFLLAGIVLYYLQNGYVTFDYIGLATGPYSGWLIFIGFAINAGVFPLHAWITDSYPESSIYGTIFLAALTTKSAVCVLARSFHGTELLVWLGLAGAVWATVYAVRGRNLRRVLSYTLVTQVGMMLCGIGLGTPLAVNGAVAHAIASDLYQTLLFMTAGAAVCAVNSDDLTQMGGLYKIMPVMAVCALIGAVSACGLPLFVGFVTKSMTMTAAHYQHLYLAWLILMLIVVMVVVHVGVKAFYLPYFKKAKCRRQRDVRINMRLAAVLVAAPCLVIGLFPGLLYKYLPYADIPYAPYTPGHMLESLLLIAVGLLAAFSIYWLARRFVFETETIPDTDFVYRKGAAIFYQAASSIFNGLNDRCAAFFMVKLPAKLRKFAHNFIFYIFIFFVEMLTRLGILTRSQERKISAYAGHTLATSTLPIGFTGLVIVIFIAIQLFFILFDR